MDDHLNIIDKMCDALALHINEQRADDDDAIICIHVAEAYNIGHSVVEKGKILMSKEILVNEITLHYRCDECGETAEQPLEEITMVGTAVCPSCDREMELEDLATIKTWNDPTVDEMFEAAMEAMDHISQANWSGRQQAAQRWLERIFNGQRDLSLNEIQDVVNKE